MVPIPLSALCSVRVMHGDPAGVATEQPAQEGALLVPYLRPQLIDAFEYAHEKRLPRRQVRQDLSSDFRVAKSSTRPTDSGAAEPLSVDLPFETSCSFRLLHPRASRRCVRQRKLGPLRLALYSLTESAFFPFHAEPTHARCPSMRRRTY